MIGMCGNKHLLIGVSRTPMEVLSRCFQRCEQKSRLPGTSLFSVLCLDSKARNGTLPRKIHSGISKR